MKCQICNKECEGKIIVRDVNIDGELIVCGDCLNDFGNQNYDSLIKKLEERDKKTNPQKMENKNNQRW